MNLQWRTLFLALVLFAVLTIGYMARAVVTPILLAVLLAYALDPVVTRLQRLRMSRNLASGVIVGLAFALVLGAGGSCGASAANQAARFYDDVVGEPLANSIDQLGAEREFREREAEPIDGALGLARPNNVLTVHWQGQKRWFLDEDGDGRFREGLARRTTAAVQEVMAKHEVTSRLAPPVGEVANAVPTVLGVMGKWLSTVLDGGQFVASTALGVLTMLLLFPIYLYVALSRLSEGYDIAVAHLPSAHRERIVSILQKIHVTLAAFFRGRVILLAIRFVILVIVFGAFGTPFFVVCAVFGSLVSLIPVLGSVVSIVVPLSLTMADGAGSGRVVALALLLVGYEVVEQYVLTPLIVGQRVGLHALTILVATLVAGDLLGVFGMLVAIPLTAVVKILWIELVMPEIRTQAGLPEPPTS